MARLKKNQKSALVKKLVTVGGILAAAQIAFILYYQQGTAPKDIKLAIEESLSRQAGISQQAKEQLRIQLAVNHYQASNGQPPQTLNELVPTYFDAIPVDPLTSKPFAYKVEGGRFYIGDRNKSPTALAANRRGSNSGSVSEADRAAREQEALIASLDETVSLVSFVYDSRGKRDPFRPYDATPVLSTKGPGLQGYDIGQLRLTAVVGRDLVTIEDQVGKGFIARKGDKIGLNNGEIVEILPDRIKILEAVPDFTGKVSNKVIEMQLRSVSNEKSKT